MSDELESGDATGFAGRARLFPLPNLVLYPHVVQALHIFEPRYRELLRDALEGDKMIAMALLAPGWETGYEGRPPLQPVACLGRIATYHELSDGRYNVLLLGLKRIRIVEELPPERSFREALVQIIEDEYPQDGAEGRVRIQRKLLEGFRRVLPLLPDMQEQVEQFMSNDTSLGILTDILAYSLPLSLDEKLLLLGEANVDRRAAFLADHLTRLGTPSGDKKPKFPPEFSQN
jgi:ATP-dependent Lon protease